MRIDQALARARLKLTVRPGIPSPEREAILLLAGMLGRSEVWIRAHSEAILSESQVQRFESWVDRRQAGESAEHILGRCSFFGRAFRVSDDVLIPRPETELMIDSALGLDLPSGARVLDVGCGSGCLGITMKAERKDLEVVAVDLSMPALEIARANANRHACRIHFLWGNLSTALGASFDLVLANLPYLPSSWIEGLPVEVRREPRMALDGGEDGLDLVRILMEDLPGILRQGAAVFLELAEGQAGAVEEMGLDLGYQDPERIRDAGGCERILSFRWNRP